MSIEPGAELISIGEVIIPFHEDRLVVQLGEDGEIYVAVRPIVEALGLNWSGQLQRIKRDAVLGKHLRTLSVVVTHTEGREAQHGQVVCLPKQYLSGFLFGISAGRIKDPKLQAKVIQFQEEAHLFLDAAFTGDAESALEAMRQKYLRQGYDEAWIKQRQITIETRNQLTDEWKGRGVQGGKYGILTAVIHRGAFDDMNPSDHRRLKGVEKGEVRDHMTGLELAFINVAEQATIANIQVEDAQGYEENYDAAAKGGRSAGAARRAFEQEHGRKVISDQSYLEQRKQLPAGEPDAADE
jgi:hypothetical protein